MKPVVMTDTMQICVPCESWSIAFDIGKQRKWILELHVDADRLCELKVTAGPKSDPLANGRNLKFQILDETAKIITTQHGLLYEFGFKSKQTGFHWDTNCKQNRNVTVLVMLYGVCNCLDATVDAECELHPFTRCFERTVPSIWKIDKASELYSESVPLPRIDLRAGYKHHFLPWLTNCGQYVIRAGWSGAHDVDTVCFMVKISPFAAFFDDHYKLRIVRFVVKNGPKTIFHCRRHKNSTLADYGYLSGEHRIFYDQDYDLKFLRQCNTDLTLTVTVDRVCTCPPKRKCQLHRFESVNGKRSIRDTTVTEFYEPVPKKIKLTWLTTKLAAY